MPFAAFLEGTPTASKACRGPFCRQHQAGVGADPGGLNAHQDASVHENAELLPVRGKVRAEGQRPRERGGPGGLIVLIEAKAHEKELIEAETGKKNIGTPVSGNARRNLMRIDWAIRDASAALIEETGLTWALSRDWNYQMSNRFAWAWKLADLGIPVVLVYLGFLSANEMSDQGKPLIVEAVL